MDVYSKQRMFRNCWRGAVIACTLVALDGALAQSLSLSSTNLTTTIDRWQIASNLTFQVGIDGTGDSSKFYWLQADESWLSVSPGSGTSTGEQDTVTVSLSTANLDPGTNTARIMVVSPVATNSPQTVDVSVVVNDDGNSNRAVRVAPGVWCVPGYTVNVPIELVAQGDENALGFTLVYDKSVFSTPTVALGGSLAGATLMTNTSQVSTYGRIGISIANPVGANMGTGVCTVATVSFAVKSTAQPKGYGFSFTNTPVVRQVSDTNAYAVSTTWSIGNIGLFSGYEAEIIPRTTGTLAAVVTLADWVQVGRFAVGLDTPTTMPEFQRADCAPRNSFGDGVLSVIDWVQAGRYYNLDDPVVVASGPISNQSSQVLKTMVPDEGKTSESATKDLTIGGSARYVSLSSGSWTRGAENEVNVVLKAVGNENALGFSVCFDPGLLQYTGAQSLVGGGVIAVRTSLLGEGKLGVTMILQPGQCFSAGEYAIMKLKFRVGEGYDPGSTTLVVTDDPVSKATVSVTAQNLSADYGGSLKVQVNGQPDVVPPVLEVSSASAGTIYTIDETINLSGTASDNWRVSDVSWKNDITTGETCDGASNWTTQATLGLGTNVVKVTATDPAGNKTSRDVTVVYVMTRAEGFADDDGDGMSNWKEFLAGTDRNNGDSVLKFTGIAPAVDAGAEGFRLEWKSVPGKQYGIFRAMELTAGFVRIGGVTASSTTSSYVDGGSVGAQQCFYRLVSE